MNTNINIEDYIAEKMAEARDHMAVKNKRIMQEQTADDNSAFNRMTSDEYFEKIHFAELYAEHSVVNSLKQVSENYAGAGDAWEEIHAVGADVSNPAQVECAAKVLSSFYSKAVSFEEASSLFSHGGKDMSDFRRECCAELFSALAEANAEGRSYGKGAAGKFIDPKYSNMEIIDFTKAIQNDRDPMVTAAFNELETMNDVEHIFDEEQMEALKECAEVSHMTQRKFMMCVNPDFFPEQMNEIAQGCADGLGVKSISAFADPAFSRKKMELIRTSMKDMNSEQRKIFADFISPDIGYKQTEAAADIIKDGKVPVLTSDGSDLPDKLTSGKVKGAVEKFEQTIKAEKINRQERSEKLQTVKHREPAL